MKALITTTINVPHNLKLWAGTLSEDDIIIVAGDTKSPHYEIQNVLAGITLSSGVQTCYLDPLEQTRWQVSSAIGWCSIQRRNIALLEAMLHKPDWILTVNDDDEPTTPDQLTNLLTVANWPFPGFELDGGWFDPGSLCEPRVTHRGMPLSVRHRVDGVGTRVRDVKVGVAEMMIIGDSDIDAVERICHSPTVHEIQGSTILAPGTWAPFNSEATMIRGELAPLLFQWPGVGRYDDIWCSYTARAVMDHLGWGVYYGNPAVRQRRNEHNLLDDLEAEIFGMRHTDELVSVLRDIKFDEDEDTVHLCLGHVFTELERRCTFLPNQTRTSFTRWLLDVQVIREGDAK